ncbi:MAG: AzlC family ABC transporter permease [Anaerovoracaceae bacterium]|nr:AzlC family ABC transporter permease [Anaerovoracaceae bacterium]
MKTYYHNGIFKTTIKKAFFNSLPVMAGYLCLGFGFGVLLENSGYGFVWAIVMSLTIYAGSMQYVAVDLLSGGATLIATALMTVMVNARHLFYGISMLEGYKDTGKLKPLLAFTLTDETYSLVCSRELIPEDVDRNKYYLCLSLMNQCYWIAGSAAGGLLGAAVSFDSTGIEFAMTSLFVIIFTEQWENAENHIPALIGILCTVACLLVFGSESFLIPSMICISMALLVMRRFGSDNAKGGDVK